MLVVVNIENVVEYPFTAIIGEFVRDDMQNSVLEVYEILLRFIYRFDTKLKGNIFCEALGDLSDNSAADLISVVGINKVTNYEGPFRIKLGFSNNVAKIKAVLKPEYITEQPGELNHQNTSQNLNPIVTLRKDHKYHIEFEACGISNLPFSFIIIRRAANNSFEIIFEKNNIELSSGFKSYSYEFTYNGEDEACYYFSFAYSNMIGGCNIRYLQVSEIE